MAKIEIRDILDENGKTIFPRTHVDAVIGLKDFSFFELAPDTQDPTKFSVRLKPEYTGFWAEGWISAGGVGTQNGGGGGLITSVKGVADLGTPIVTESLTETFSAKAVESIYEAVVDINSRFGAALSITSDQTFLKDSNGKFLVDSNGNYLVSSGSSTSINLLNRSNNVISTITLPTETFDISSLNVVTISGNQTITGAKTFSSTLSVNAGISVNGLSTIEQNTNDHLALFNYGGRSTQSFNAYGTVVNLRSYNASAQANILSVQADRITVGSQLIPNYTTGINLGGSSSNQRWSTIYGANANLTGNLVMSATSYIDIGPVRIEYDSVNKAIHIKKADDNDNNEYGLYCEGFIASGGAQATS